MTAAIVQRSDSRYLTLYTCRDPAAALVLQQVSPGLNGRTVAICCSVLDDCRHGTRDDSPCRMCDQVYGVLVGPAKALPGTKTQEVRGTGNLAPLISLPDGGLNITDYKVVITQSPGYWAP